MRAEPTSTPTTAELIALVVAVPGVTGIEPGIGTALRALDARIRRVGSDSTHFGLHIDREGRRVTVEVCLDPSRPVRTIVRDIQSVMRDALGATLLEGTELEVRVQSLHQG